MAFTKDQAHNIYELMIRKSQDRQVRMFVDRIEEEIDNHILKAYRPDSPLRVDLFYTTRPGDEFSEEVQKNVRERFPSWDIEFEFSGNAFAVLR